MEVERGPNRRIKEVDQTSLSPLPPVGILTFFGGRGLVGGGPLCVMRREESSSGGVALCRSPGVVMEPVEAERPRITWDFSASPASSVLAGRWEGGFCVHSS